MRRSMASASATTSSERLPHLNLSSMPSISERFAERRGEGRATLVPYVTSGFPSRSATVDVLAGLAEAGGDVLELGIPFSDPLADGPTIQDSTFRALEGGMSVAETLEVLAEFRRGSDTPIVLFSYLNPLLRYGLEAFLADAEEAGAQGLLLTDVPTGADPQIEEAILASALDLIRLIAPTTRPDRAAAIAKNGQGFLYYISRTGVTGAREALAEDLEDEVRALREVVELPVAVGFGISTPEQAALVSGVADGVIVGSALIRALDEGGPEGAGAFLASLRSAMDEVSSGAEVS
jgi:tryptophan synthase alpha chain